MKNFKRGGATVIPGGTFIPEFRVNSSIHAGWSEIQFEANHFFMSQKLKKLKEEESQPFGPSCAAGSL